MALKLSKTPPLLLVKKGQDEDGSGSVDAAPGYAPRVAKTPSSGEVETNDEKKEKPMKKSAMNDIFKSAMGPHFVADDNDNPTSGGSGQVEPSRPGGGVSENDVIAPLLKSCKGSEAGAEEEFPISKSEMETMGMSTEGLAEGWYRISKSELRRLGMQAHVDYLAERKERVAKSLTPLVQKSVTSASVASSVQQGARPRPNGNAPNLVIWSTGSDEAMAAYLAKSTGYGPGTDEPVRAGAPDNDEMV